MFFHLQLLVWLQKNTFLISFSGEDNRYFFTYSVKGQTPPGNTNKTVLRGDWKLTFGDLPQ